MEHPLRAISRIEVGFEYFRISDDDILARRRPRDTEKYSSLIVRLVKFFLRRIRSSFVGNNVKARNVLEATTTFGGKGGGKRVRE